MDFPRGSLHCPRTHSRTFQIHVQLTQALRRTVRRCQLQTAFPRKIRKHDRFPAGSRTGIQHTPGNIAIQQGKRQRSGGVLNIDHPFFQPVLPEEGIGIICLIKTETGGQVISSDPRTFQFRQSRFRNLPANTESDRRVGRIMRKDLRGRFFPELFQPLSRRASGNEYGGMFFASFDERMERMIALMKAPGPCP